MLFLVLGLGFVGFSCLFYLYSIENIISGKEKY